MIIADSKLKELKMQLKKDSVLVRLVYGAGVEGWCWRIDEGRLNLCPFFWMVVGSILLLPFRPLTTQSELLRGMYMGAWLTTWAGVHLYHWQLAKAMLMRENIWQLVATPMQSLFVFLLVIEVTLLLMAIVLILMAVCAVGVVSVFDRVSDWKASRQTAGPAPEKPSATQGPTVMTPTAEPGPVRKAWAWLGKTFGAVFRPLGGPLGRIYQPIHSAIGDFFTLLFEFLAAKKKRFCPPIELVT